MNFEIVWVLEMCNMYVDCHWNLLIMKCQCCVATDAHLKQNMLSVMTPTCQTRLSPQVKWENCRYLTPICGYQIYALPSP